MSSDLETAPSYRSAPLPVEGLPEASVPLPAIGPSRDHRLKFLGGIWPRIAVVLVLFGVGYGPTFAADLSAALAGSRTGLLLLAPVMIALSATGYRNPPSGVEDHEFDWIAASLVGLIGFGSVGLIRYRYPTLSDFWRLDLIGAVIWVVCAAVIVLGVRHTVRMWRVWIFAVICATPVPFQLLTATLGGSDQAGAVVGAMFGTVATYLASTRCRPRVRYPATLFFGVANVGIARLMIDHTNLLATLLVVAGAMPLLAAVILHHFIEATSNQRWAIATTGYPRRSWRSFTALAVAGGILLVTHPLEPLRTDPPSVRADWVQRAGLDHYDDFPFISRFIGGRSTLARYQFPERPDSPAAAVDIITTPNLAALHDYSNAVWYPVSRPVNYHHAGSDIAPPYLNAEVAHTNVYEAANGACDWFAITWIWQAATEYQQVTVIIDQSDTSFADIPEPQQLSVASAAVRPTLWIARQQPEWTGPVDKVVLNRAAEIVRILVAAGRPDGG